MFRDQDNVIDYLPKGGMFLGIVEGGECIASFTYERDARDYADYLATIGRSVEVVEFLALAGLV